MRLLQNIKKLYSSILRRTLWIASSCFSTPLRNHPRKDAKRLTEKLRFSVFASHLAKRPRSCTWDTLKPLLFVFVFVIFTLSFFNIDTQSVDAQGRGNGAAEVEQRKKECNGAENCFIPLVGIPYIDNPNDISSMAEYVSALYKISISIAAFLAVIKIIFAGVKYMLSDVVTDKGAAKKDIRGALIGLLIVIGAVLILNTINPQLRNLNVLSGPGVDITLRTPDVGQPTSGPEFCATLSASDSCNIKTCVSRDWIRNITGNEKTGMGGTLFALCKETCNTLKGLYIGSSGTPRCYYSDAKYNELLPQQEALFFGDTEINTSITYTINDPDGTVSAAYNNQNIIHGDEVSIIGVKYPFLIIKTSTGEVIQTGIGCKQIQPAIIPRCEIE